MEKNMELYGRNFMHATEQGAGNGAIGHRLRDWYVSKVPFVLYIFLFVLLYLNNLRVFQLEVLRPRELWPAHCCKRN